MAEKIPAHLTFNGKPVCRMGPGTAEKFFGTRIPQCSYPSIASARRKCPRHWKFKVVRGDCPDAPGGQT